MAVITINNAVVKIAPVCLVMVLLTATVRSIGFLFYD